MQRHTQISAPAAEPRLTGSMRSIAVFCLLVIVGLCAAVVQPWPPIPLKTAPNLNPSSLGELFASSLGSAAPTSSAAPATSETGGSTPDTGRTQRVVLSAEQIDTAVAATLQLLLPHQGWRSAAQLTSGQLAVQASLPLRDSSLLGLQPSITLAFTIADASDGRLPIPSAIRLGYLPVPFPLANWASRRLLTRGSQRRTNTLLDAQTELERAFQGLTITPEALVAGFAWQSEALDRLSWDLQRGLVDERAAAAAPHYDLALRDYLDALPQSQRAVALSALLPLLAQQAQDRTQAGANPITENTAALFALSSYLAAATGVVEGQKTQQQQAEIRLRRRQDLAQHVVNSAAIAAIAGVEIAEIISTGKEAFDARYRSGFSFSDLTANRVGIQLAELAVTSEDSAREFQRRLQDLQSDTELIPLVGGNRDGLSQREFERQYQSRMSDEYRERIEDIDKEVAQLALFAEYPEP